MKRPLTIGAIVVVLALLGVPLGIQLIPVDRTNPPVESDIPTSPAVKAALRRACYDCHSNETEWPWYSHIAPISWVIATHVREGRASLNFSTWDRYSTQQQVQKLKESWVTTTEGDMPPWFYLPIHRDAGLSPDDRALLRQWALQP